MKKLQIFVLVVLCLSAPSLVMARRGRHRFRGDTTKQEIRANEIRPERSKKSRKASKEEAWSCEKASYQYVLLYQAYIVAKNCKKTNKYLIGFLRNYRSAYADYLEQARKLNIGTPLMPQDPAGEFNDAQVAMGNSNDEREFVTGELKKHCRTITNMVLSGKKPKEVRQYARQVASEIELSYAPNDVPNRCPYCIQYRMFVQNKEDAKQRAKLCPGLIGCACNLPYDPTCPCCQRHIRKSKCVPGTNGCRCKSSGAAPAPNESSPNNQGGQGATIININTPPSIDLGF